MQFVLYYRGSAYLEGYNETVFRDISIHVEETTDNWLLNVSIYFANNTRGFVKGTVNLNIIDVNSTDAIVVKANNEKEFVFSKSLKIPKAS